MTNKKAKPHRLQSLLLLLAILSWGCSDKNGSVAPPASSSGTFSLLTYNVAGLPQGASASNPATNNALMSSLLNHYDIALVQEDFFYHAELSGQANHPFQSTPKAIKNEYTNSDGLNRFSSFPFSDFRRVQWDTCSNASAADCFVRKGFSVAETELASGVVVDIYNVHFDAGGQPGDIAARLVQVADLVTTILSRSAGKAIIVAGDFNLDIVPRVDDLEMFADLLEATELADACHTMNCGTELVDRVLFRSSSNVSVMATSWRIDDRFVDSAGEKLSDHFAVGVDFQWQVVQ